MKSWTNQWYYGRHTAETWSNCHLPVALFCRWFARRVGGRGCSCVRTSVTPEVITRNRFGWTGNSGRCAFQRQPSTETPPPLFQIPLNEVQIHIDPLYKVFWHHFSVLSFTLLYFSLTLLYFSITSLYLSFIIPLLFLHIQYTFLSFPLLFPLFSFTFLSFPLLFPLLSFTFIYFYFSFTFRSF